MSRDLSSPQVMGILNVTPDSFSDGGDFVHPEVALKRVAQMVAEGVDIIDIGGESTRPGAAVVAVEEELQRVVPLIEAITAVYDVPVSVDTKKPQVMQAAVAAGASMINDVRALQAPGALEVAAESQVTVCLMHMQGEPQIMQGAPHYSDVVAEVLSFLAARVEIAVAAGVARERLLIDPGFGFGKTLAHNLSLLGDLQRFTSLGLPLMVGLSRKSMFGELLGRSVDERLSGSIVVATLALQQGASIIRTHDVAATVDAVKVCAAVNMASERFSTE